ncbi:putative ribosome biogenesis protein, partial [Smittium culicis]
MSQLAINQDQVLKASSALLEYLAKKASNKSEKADLLGDDEAETVRLLLTTKNISLKNNFKPARIPLKSSIYNEETSVCLITKDPSKAYDDRVKKSGISFVHKVIDVQDLKSTYLPFEARRNLRDSYQLFMVDDRIAPKMPKLLGNKFFERKKQPVNVDLTKSDIKRELTKALNSTYLYPSTGSNLSIKIGSSDFTPEQLCENIINALPHITEKIPKKALNIK